MQQLEQSNGSPVLSSDGYCHLEFIATEAVLMAGGKENVVGVVLQLPWQEGMGAGSHQTYITENLHGLEMAKKAQVNPGYLRCTDL